MTDTPDRIWAEEIGTATKGGQRFRIGRWITDETASHPHEYIRADVARADADLAAAEAIRRAAEAGADIAERTRPDGFPEVASNAYHSGAMDVVDAILALAPADALAEVQRLREERAFTLSDGQRLLRKCDVEGVCDATDLCFENPNTVVRCGPCAAKVSSRAGLPLNPYTHSNPEAMRLRRERDAALAEVQRLREERNSLKAFIENDADWKFSAKRRLQLLREMRAERDAALAQLDRHLSIFADHAAVVWGIIRAAGDLPGLADGPYKDGFIAGMEEVAARGDIQAADCHHQLQNLCEQIVALVTGEATLVMAPAEDVASKMAAAADRDAALARVEKLRRLMPETLASLEAVGCNNSLVRDIRAALDEDARHG